MTLFSSEIHVPIQRLIIIWKVEVGFQMVSAHLKVSGWLKSLFFPSHFLVKEKCYCTLSLSLSRCTVHINCKYMYTGTVGSLTDLGALKWTTIPSRGWGQSSPGVTLDPLNTNLHECISLGLRHVIVINLCCHCKYFPLVRCIPAVVFGNTDS